MRLDYIPCKKEFYYTRCKTKSFRGYTVLACPKFRQHLMILKMCMKMFGVENTFFDKLTTRQVFNYLDPILIY